MDKILVSVYVLSIDEEYDLFISINENVGKAIHIMQKAIVELSHNCYQINQSAVLYNGIDGKMINNNNIVKFSGLTNGAKLLLI